MSRRLRFDRYERSRQRRQKAPNGARRRFRLCFERVDTIYVEVVACSKEAAREIATGMRSGERRVTGSAPGRTRAVTILREEEL